MSANYQTPAAQYDFGDLMPVDEFRRSVAVTLFTDDDGFGNPYRAGHINIRCEIQPSRLNIPRDATHVLWFNR